MSAKANIAESSGRDGQETGIRGLAIMTLHLVAWCCLFGLLVVLTFRQPRWGIALFFLTIYANPAYWWWGGPLAGERVNLLAVLILAASLAFHGQLRLDFGATATGRRASGLTLLIVANVITVHLLLAPDWSVSWIAVLDLCKYLLFFAMLISLIRTPEDFKFLLVVLVCGLAYWGEEKGLLGDFSGRLEKLGGPSCSDSNIAALQIAIIIPLAGALLLTASGWQRLLGAFAAATGVELLNRCNSRGSFLAMIAAGCIFLLVAAGPRTRRKAITAVALGMLAALAFLARDPRVVGRFDSIFVPAEERDASAQVRTIVWTGGLSMLADYPLGSGGDAFKRSSRGFYYKELLATEFRQEIGRDDSATRALHNGYLQEATSWGVQGLVLKLLLLANVALGALKTLRAERHQGDANTAFLGACIIASLTVFAVGAMFVDVLDNENFYWIVAVAVTYSNAYGSVPYATPVETVGRTCGVVSC